MSIALLVSAGIAGWAGWFFWGAGVNQARDAAGGDDDRSVWRRAEAERDKKRGAFLYIASGVLLLAALYFWL